MRTALITVATAFYSISVVSAKYIKYCDAPVDVLFLQDTTESFGPFLQNVASHIPNLLSSLLEASPSSRFGAAQYKDRPYWALGFQDDTCYDLITPLTQDISSIQKAYARMDGSSGADTKEGHYYAIVNAVYDPAVNWQGNKERSRLIILSTDASPHLPNDYITYTSDQWIATAWNQRQMPDYFPAHPGRPVNTDNFTEDCMTYDYPSFTQVKEALEAQETYMAIFIPRNKAQVYNDWSWVNNELLGQDPAFLNFVEMDGSGFMEAASLVMEKITTAECLSTVPPTTEAPTTTTVTEPPLPTREPAGNGTEPTFPEACAEECDCWRCATPKSFIRFEEGPDTFYVKVRY